MIQAYKDDKGKVKTQLDVFEYAKWGDKNDPARKNIFSNSILIDMYLTGCRKMLKLNSLKNLMTS